MIKIILTVLLMLISSSLISQAISARYSTELLSSKLIGNFTYVNLTNGTLQADDIDKIGKSTYWIRKGQFVNKNNSTVIDFREKLYVNNIQVIEQVEAKNGYIITFYEDNNYISVWLSDKRRLPDSDELYFSTE